MKKIVIFDQFQYLAFSGVFRISVRRGRRTLSVEDGGAGPLPRKNLFVPKMITLTQLLTGSSLGTMILRFTRETKLTKTVRKLYKNSRSDQGEGSRTIATPLNTPLLALSRK